MFDKKRHVEQAAATAVERQPNFRRHFVEIALNSWTLTRQRAIVA
jgi:hypothetical protein